MLRNYYLGRNELVIVFEDGGYLVKEASYNYDTVFSGLLEKCEEYCERRQSGYMVSVIG